MLPLKRTALQRTESLHSWWSDRNPLGPTIPLHTLAKPLSRLLHRRQVAGILADQQSQPLSGETLDILTCYLETDSDEVPTVSKLLILQDLNFRAQWEEQTRSIARQNVLAVLNGLLYSPKLGIVDSACVLIGTLGTWKDGNAALVTLNPCKYLIHLASSSADGLRKASIYALTCISYWEDGARSIAAANPAHLCARLLQSQDVDILEWACRMVGEVARCGTILITAQSSTYAHLNSLAEHPEPSIQKEATYALALLRELSKPTQTHSPPPFESLQDTRRKNFGRNCINKYMVNASIVEGNTADGSSAFFRNRSKSKHDEGGEKEDPRKVLSLPDATRAQVAKKYGKWGRVLGRGRDGTVRLIKGSAGSGGAVFAVKQFHERRTGKSEKEYQKKITAHFCVGIALKNQNVIETIDIVWDNGNYYEVMEYAPFDLYSILMTGKMSRIEIYCVFRQICAGVEYLHELGLAHRNLKLEKCLLTADNVVKLIDFGSATVFHYPGRTIALATGIVGSDNYIAPEVFGGEPYDLRKADVWSIGIMFVSFMLRRFPWRLADPETDRSFKAFVDAGFDIALGLPMRTRKNIRLLTISFCELAWQADKPKQAQQAGKQNVKRLMNSKVASGNAPDLRDSKSLGPRGTRTSTAASIDSYTDTFIDSNTTSSPPGEPSIPGLPSSSTESLPISSREPYTELTFPSSPTLHTTDAPEPQRTTLERRMSVPTPDIPTPTSHKQPEGTHSDAMLHPDGSESLFRLLPRETRPALRRMLCVEPAARCTLTDLLKGKGKGSRLLCGCPSRRSQIEDEERSAAKLCADHDCDPEDEDEGDEWLRSIEPCSHLLDGAVSTHSHVLLALEHKRGRRPLF